MVYELPNSVALVLNLQLQTHQAIKLDLKYLN